MSNYEFLKNTTLAQATAYSDNFIQLQEKNGQIVYKNSDYYALNDKRSIVQVSPTTQVPTNLSNAQIDIKIERTIDVIEYVTLQWTYFNNTGAPASVTCAPFHVQRIDVTPNGSNVLYQTYAQEMYQQYFMLDRNTYESQASAVGLDNAYNNLGTVVPDGGSLVMSLPLYGFWKATKMAICAMKIPLLLRIYFESSNLFVLSGGVMTCQDLKLIIRGKTLKQQAKQELMTIYDNTRIPLSLSHLSVDRQANTVNLQASQTLKYVLTGITGIISHLIFTIRLASDANSAVGQNNYVRMDSFDVLDSQGASLIGFYQRDSLTQQIDYANTFGNDAWNSKGFHIVSWSNNPRQAFATGQNAGYAVFTGNEYLEFKCPATLPTNSYLVDVRAWAHENILISGMTMKSTRL